MFRVASYINYQQKENSKSLKVNIQQSLKEVQYIIIDENLTSMVGRKMFGQIDVYVKHFLVMLIKFLVVHAFSSEILVNFHLFFDFPLYTDNQSSNLSDLGRTAYMSFTKAIVLTHIMHQTGEDLQVAFRDILLRLWNANVTQDDWKHLMTHTSSNISNLQEFKNAIHLYPTVEAVAEHYLMKLKQPIARSKMFIPGHNAAKVPQIMLVVLNLYYIYLKVKLMGGSWISQWSNGNS